MAVVSVLLIISWGLVNWLIFSVIVAAVDFAARRIFKRKHADG
jgi:hypothetical protein